MVFLKETSTQLTTFERRYDQDGKVWIQAVAHANLTALTGYMIIVNEFGNVTAAQADVEDYIYMGFPAAAVSSGAVAWLQIGGYVADIITPSLSIAVGHALSFSSGAIVDTNADYAGNPGEFAVCAVVSSSSTTQTVMLVPERFLTIT